MKHARIADLKNNLSRYLEHVRAGGTVLVVDRDRPIARIVPLERGRRTVDDDRLGALEREGLIPRGTGKLPSWFRRRRPRKGSTGVLEALLEERRSGW